MERDAQYDKVFDGIKEAYGPKILAKLSEIQAACEAEGLGTRDPADMCDDEFRWSLLVSRPEDGDYDEAIDVSITIEEQREHDGGEGFGLNFSIQVTEYDGTIVGGVSPFNYTPFVWVDARIEEVVEKRWQIIAGLDDFPIPTLIMDGRR